MRLNLYSQVFTENRPYARTKPYEASVILAVTRGELPLCPTLEECGGRVVPPLWWDVAFRYMAHHPEKRPTLRHVNEVMEANGRKRAWGPSPLDPNVWREGLFHLFKATTIDFREYDLLALGHRSLNLSLAGSQDGDAYSGADEDDDAPYPVGEEVVEVYAVHLRPDGQEWWSCRSSNGYITSTCNPALSLFARRLFAAIVAL